MSYKAYGAQATLAYVLLAPKLTILATGVPGKPDFGLMGWNCGDFGNLAPDTLQALNVKAAKHWAR